MKENNKYPTLQIFAFGDDYKEDAFTISKDGKLYYVRITGQENFYRVDIEDQSGRNYLHYPSKKDSTTINELVTSIERNQEK